MKFLHDTWILFGRNMRHFLRSPESFMEVIVVPILFMFMFVYVFGGAIQTGTSTGNYINYMLPGVISIAIVNGTVFTALRLFNDRQKGLMARFHSMPVSRQSILWAQVLTSLVSNAISVAIIILVAFIIGFRSNAGILEWVTIITLLGIFTLALSWLAVIPGLIAKSTDGALAFAYPLFFLPFVSSAFVPTETMPYFVRIFTENQPITPIVNVIRSLLSSNHVGNDILIAFAWCIGIMVVAYFISMRIYKNQTD